MAYENRPGQGALFPHDKQGNPNRPDYSGNINIGGKEYDISAWFKTSRAGNQYLSITATEPYQQQAPQPQYQQPQQPYQQQAPRAPQRQYQRQAPAPQPAQPAPQQEGKDLPF